MEDSSDQICVRQEGFGDAESVRRVNISAFRQPGEADLVDELRHSDVTILSLVGVADDGIVGHLLLTRVNVECVDTPAWSAAAVGPMAVVPQFQRRGIGSALVRTGLDHCQANEWPVVFVLGHPGFYPKFGFRPARPLGFECEWDVPDDVFMVAELKPQPIVRCAGIVRYARAFSALP